MALDGRSELPVSVGDANELVAIANVFVKHFKVKSPLGPARQEVDDGSFFC